MKFVHKSSIEWMRDRSQYLTASEIRKLVPLTAGGRKKNITDDMRLEVLANKMREIREDDCMSYGVMARGHLLEPYAIGSFNLISGLPNLLYHWDDRVLTRDGVLGFSPDALDVPMDMSNEDAVEKATIIGEVKSYEAGRHLLTAAADKSTLEERWQIATAMMVCKNADVAYLILYNPDMTKLDLQVIALKYKRDELESELSIIEEVKEDWLDFLDRFDFDELDVLKGSSCVKADDIYDYIQKNQELNPF